MKKPNFLFIIADQLTWRALPAYGNEWVKTPNIDSIADNAVRFSHCYTACPLCQPARASFWTGLYPHSTGVLSNGRKWHDEPVSDDVPTLGETLTNGGYTAVHFGKTHDGGALRGFDVVELEETEMKQIKDGVPLFYDSFNDRNTTIKTVDYLSKYSDDKPFAVVADLQNPHDICNWIGAYKDDTENPYLNEPLPPLPENFTVEDMHTRPKAVQYICCSHNRQAQAAMWDDKKYRQYLSAYYSYLEMLDSDIGEILDALKQNGKYDDTIIVFWADHGDSMTARGRVTKQVDFYEEVARVPLMFSGKGVERCGEEATLASLNDLFPTVCSLAGLNIPEGLHGVDLLPTIKGTKSPKRDYVASEWQTEWGYTVSPGRMIRTDRYKYMRYLENNECELYDLHTDPYEKTNLSHKAEYADILDMMEQYLQHHIKTTNDNFENLTVTVDPMWRTHEGGYHKHKGIAAPQYTE